MEAVVKYHSRVDRTLPIERRILNALIYIVHIRKRKPKAIYLTKADMALLPRKHRRQIDGIPVRQGSSSMFFSDCWWGRGI